MFWLWFSIISFSLTGIFFFWMHGNKDYNIHASTVSEFIHTPHAKKLWATMICNSLGYVGLAGYLWKENLWLSILLLIASVLSFLVAAVPVNPAGHKRNATAYSHIVIAGSFFTAILTTMYVLHSSVIETYSFGEIVLLGALMWFSRLAVVVFLLVAIIFGESVYGIPQRVFIVSTFTWSFAFSLCSLI